MAVRRPRVAAAGKSDPMLCDHFAQCFERSRKIRLVCQKYEEQVDAVVSRVYRIIVSIETTAAEECLPLFGPSNGFPVLM